MGAAVAQCPLQLLVRSPLVGLNSQARAVRELGRPWKSTHMYDLEASLRAPLRYLDGYENDQLLHLGHLEGDIMNNPLEDLPRPVDGLIAGPPCPPHSSIGLRRSWKDSIISVVDQVASWILHFSQDREFLLWVLENVEGIFKRSGEEDDSWGQRFMQQSGAEFGKNWVLRVQCVDASDCDLVQSRPRVFMIGVHQTMLASTHNKRILNQPLHSHRRPSLLDTLDMERHYEDFESLCELSKVNVTAQLQRFHVWRLEHIPLPHVAIFDAARNSDDR